jgi:acetyl-CoA C-acetyltransferase
MQPIRRKPEESQRERARGENPVVTGPPDPVVVVSAKRTPIGRFLGALSGHTVVDLGEIAVRGALRDLPPDLPVSHVILGCARQAGTGPNPARQVAVRSELGDGVVALTINMACASGMEAIAAAARAIRLGEADWVVAGGMESMSRVPFLAERFRTGYRLGNAQLVDAMYRDGFSCPLAGQLMGETAETLARRYGISRAEQDEYAMASQTRAAAARASGRFRDELVPVRHKGTGAKGGKPSEGWALEEDEHIRPDTTRESLARLAPVFARDGTVTAGNASGITDGAAALVLTRHSEAARRGLPVLARVRAWETAGVDPRVMGIGPVPAVRRLLQRESLALGEIDRIELNEAFAAQVLAVDRELDFPAGHWNVNGGAIALGHPIGCSGARIVVTLLHEMRKRDSRLGLATLCVSGGLGMAMLLERGA